MSLVIFVRKSLSGVPHTCRILVSWSMWSLPGNRTCPVSSSAIMQPTDQMSTEEGGGGREREGGREEGREEGREGERERGERESQYKRTNHLHSRGSTLFVVVHPVQHDLWGPPVPRSDISGHLIVCSTCQPKV